MGTGAILREQVGNESALGKLAAPILARGEYLPDELMLPVLADWLSRQSGGWVLDGFPRSVPQACFLDEWLAGRNMILDAAISLETSFDGLISRIGDRLECQECRWSGKSSEAADHARCPECAAPARPRPDDSVENLTSRYQEFLRLTRPVIGHYRERNLLCPCDATAPRDEVTAKLLGHFASTPGDHSDSDS